VTGKIHFRRTNGALACGIPRFTNMSSEPGETAFVNCITCMGTWAYRATRAAEREAEQEREKKIAEWRQVVATTGELRGFEEWLAMPDPTQHFLDVIFAGSSN
jgi:hypothetical protein